MTAENNPVGAREPRMHVYALFAYKQQQACAPPFADELLPDPFMLLGSPHTHPTSEWTLTQPCACRDSSPLPPITPADYFLACQPGTLLIFFSYKTKVLPPAWGGGKKKGNSEEKKKKKQ